MPAKSKQSPVAVKPAGERAAEIVIYDLIEPYYGVGAKQIRDELKALGPLDRIDVRLNSDGGLVFDGLAIYQTLKQHAARVVVHVDGLAASIASVIAMAGDEIHMSTGSFVMIHNPAVGVWGEADEHQAAAEFLAKVKNQLVEIYAARSGQTPEKIGQLMDATTWLDPAEAVELGLATHVDQAPAIAALLDPRRYDALGTVPARARALVQASAGQQSPPPSQSEDPMSQPATTPATFDEITAAVPKADEKFIVAQLKAKATLDQARAAWLDELEARLTQASQQLTAQGEELATLKAKGAETPKKPGVEALGAGKAKASAGEGDTDPRAAWNEAIEAKIRAGMTRQRAAQAVNREHPELREAMVAAANQR